MIGKNISEIRKRRGFTLSQLAERANISKSYLSNIERNLNDNPSLHILEKISGVLNIELVTLLNPENEEKNFLMEKEWIDFIYELKKSGIKKDQIQQYKPLIDFIKWQNRKV